MGDISVRPKDNRVNVRKPLSPRAEDAPTAPPAPAGRLRAVRRPRLWFELLLIAVSYAVYSAVRNAAPARVEQAQDHARWVWDLQGSIGLDFEHAVNHAIAKVTWLIVPMNYYYATLHFAVTIGVLIWLFRWHPGRYGSTRLVLFVTTGVALVGYYFFPLAPPRLMAGMDFIDTSSVHHTWGSLSAEGTTMAEVSNQYAAMPSMHIGWSTWCGLTIAILAKPLWIRVLGVLYPVLTLLVIVATANHFWLDAVGGLVCLGFGFLVSRLWYGRLCYRLPRDVAAGPAAGAPPATAPAPARPATAARTAEERPRSVRETTERPEPRGRPGGKP
ncbi:phosphatase PAP2 family protein [Streptomyces sp. RFCAC02]|uniref:phosphatase PAP2 family protein n=1 Tax=Streptomyces sp. RFCAC02 TaxID=2499143 RepID=UPI001021AB0E|nr:phosphatase PAP2 family protein [Streptomyces sp. RFCAC02]